MISTEGVIGIAALCIFVGFAAGVFTVCLLQAASTKMPPRIPCDAVEDGVTGSVPPEMECPYPDEAHMSPPTRIGSMWTL